MWPNGDLSAGGTGETKRVSIGAAAITFCQPAWFPPEYVTYSPARKEGMLKDLKGIGDLNVSHLSRVLHFAAGAR
jgi:hypothetical protein